ncbi:MAG: hydrogenase accessory protein HypB [Piscirickettsiaceae bacterium]|nr:MAG: hydrogenase accessory protein HypB [Piscirickettsiaceae bacterium]
MCVTCGCSDNAKATITNLDTGNVVLLEADDHGHSHDHSHDHDHDHEHSHDDHAHDHEHPHDHSHSHEQSSAHTHANMHGTTISLEADILAKNDLLAERNRGWFDGKNILALNMVSSPGSGKTTLLERTITDLKQTLPINVVEGDQETVNDAARIKSTGCRVVQINTGTGCHLDADMLARGLKELQPPADSVVMIENVGNLVCPALFDLGEKCKVVVLSVTEGEDKPIKYPHMFRAAEVMILNKIDLLPYLNFDVEDCINYAKTVNPNIKIFQLSATTGEGMDDWYLWLKAQVDQNKQSVVSS